MRTGLVSRLGLVFLCLVCSCGSVAAKPDILRVKILTHPSGAALYLDTPATFDSEHGSYLGLSGTTIDLDRNELKGTSSFPIKIVAPGYKPKYEKVPRYWSQPQFPEDSVIQLQPKNQAVGLLTWAEDHPYVVGLSLMFVLTAAWYGKQKRMRVSRVLDKARAIEELRVQPDKDDPYIAARIGSYRLVEKLGKGAFSTVYKAVPEETLKQSHEVAVKILNSETTEDFLGRFYREVKLCGKLEHPNVVRLYDWGEQDGIVFLAMEYVDGGSFQDLLKKAPLSVQDLTGHLLPVLEAMAYVHTRGVVHRDLKPANILLSEAGIPKVADFGLAKPLQGGEDLTATNTALGTPAYMAPEQLTNAKKVDKRCDQFSLGILAYTLLNGKNPFKSGTWSKTLMKILSETPPPIHTVRPDVPRPLSDMISKMLAKEPEDRYPDLHLAAEAFREAVNSVES